MRWWSLWWTQRELSSVDPQQRRVAASRLARDGDLRAVRLLLHSLGDMDGQVRASAITGLARLMGRNALDHVLRVLDDEDEYARSAAIEALKPLVEPLALVPLLDRLGDPHPDLRLAAARALAALNETHPELKLGRLARTAGDLLALGACGDPRAFRPLLMAAGSNDAHTRREAATGLAQLRLSNTLRVLSEMCKDPSPEVRLAAAMGLVQHHDVRAVAPLLRLLEFSTLREAASESLVALGSAAAPALCQQVGVLGRAPRHAAQVLARIAAPECVDCLLDLLLHHDPQVREAVAESLGSLAAKHPEMELTALAATGGALDQLATVGDERLESRFRPLLASQDSAQRAAASQALGQPPTPPHKARRANLPKMRVRTRNRPPRLDLELG